jgi:hypothetical protein
MLQGRAEWRSPREDLWLARVSGGGSPEAQVLPKRAPQALTTRWSRRSADVSSFTVFIPESSC